MKARLSGKPLWMPNMVAARASGALSIPHERMGWASGSILEGVKSFFSSHTRFDLGDGSKIRFWDNVWYGETSLKVAFPILYNIADVKDTIVATNMDLSSGTLQWNISFIRLINDWKVDTLASYSLLYSIKSRREGDDKLWWNLSRKGTFDVRSFYKTIAYKDNLSFSWKSIWRTKAPSKAAFFVWLVSLGKILILDNFRKRQVIMVNQCFLCKLDGESIDHLLHYEVAHAL
jgi:hypothetical protein